MALFVSTAVVRKTLSPASTGEDQPRPGMDCFQTTLLVEDQCTGRFVAIEIPCPVGPRNSGHNAGPPEGGTPSRATIKLAMTVTRRFWKLVSGFQTERATRRGKRHEIMDWFILVLIT